jgi:hypothetical protein
MVPGNNRIVTSRLLRAQQGISVVLSGDGNTAIVGGPGDNSHAGATRVFTTRTPSTTVL